MPGPITPPPQVILNKPPKGSSPKSAYQLDVVNHTHPLPTCKGSAHKRYCKGRFLWIGCHTVYKRMFDPRKGMFVWKPHHSVCFHVIK